MASFNTKMSIYIPRVDTRSLPKVTGSADDYETAAKEFVAKQFKFQKIGEVERVDLVAKKTPEGYSYYLAFIHFKEWFNTPAAHILQDAIIDPQQKAKLQFHENWYWIVAENRKPRTADEVSLQLVVQAQKEEIDALKVRLATIVVAATVELIEQPIPMPKRMESSDVSYLHELLLSRQVEIYHLLHLLADVVEAASVPEPVSESELEPPPKPTKLVRQTNADEAAGPLLIAENEPLPPLWNMLG